MSTLGSLALCGLLLLGADSGKKGSARMIRWPELTKLNVKTGKMPKSLARKLRSPIKIEGYVIPLEGDGKGVTSFVLVSDPMYCGHVPPPPPNQLILVELDKPKPWDEFQASIYVTGKLGVVDQKSQFGGYMYKVKRVDKIEKGPSFFDIFR